MNLLDRPNEGLKMATELQKLIKNAREVQLTTDVAKELAIPIQKLINLTQ